VFAQFRGTLLAADDAPVVLEGAWPRDKLALMSFPDEVRWSRASASGSEGSAIAATITDVRL
jgi:uncharacterized protein (DUF1330 family)